MRRPGWQGLGVESHLTIRSSRDTRFSPMLLRIAVLTPPLGLARGPSKYAPKPFPLGGPAHPTGWLETLQLKMSVLMAFARLARPPMMHCTRESGGAVTRVGGQDKMPRPTRQVSLRGFSVCRSWSFGVRHLSNPRVSLGKALHLVCLVGTSAEHRAGG